MDDRELIVRSQAGDKTAFGELYDRHIRSIYTFIFYKTHHKEVAEDLTSQTFFKALNSIKKADAERPFRSWLYRIAQNTVIDHYRSSRATRSIDDIWDISDDTDIVSELDTSKQIGELKKHLHALSSAERDIIIMRVWQEMPYKDIAEIVGKSEASCKMLYSRSLQKLRKIMPLASFLLLFTTR